MPHGYFLEPLLAGHPCNPRKSVSREVSIRQGVKTRRGRTARAHSDALWLNEPEAEHQVRALTAALQSGDEQTFTEVREQLVQLAVRLLPHQQLTDGRADRLPALAMRAKPSVIFKGLRTTRPARDGQTKWRSILRLPPMLRV